MPIANTGHHVKSLLIQRHWFWSEISKPPPRREKSAQYVNLRFMIIEQRIKRIMARAKSNENKNNKKPEWKGYKNINIPASHVGECENYMADTKSVWQDFLTLLNKGYTIKQYLDMKDESYKCTLHCVNVEDPNAGYAMSAYGGDWYTALSCALFKHYVIADEDWDTVDIGEKRQFG